MDLDHRFRSADHKDHTLFYEKAVT